MTASKLLTTVSVASVTCCNTRVVLLHQHLKIFRMTELPVKHLLLRSLRTSASVPEAVLSTYLNLVGSMANPSTHQEFKKTIMDPFLESCYTPSNTAPTCDIPFNISAGSVIGHDSKMENIGNNINVDLCMGSSRSLEDNKIDKQRYRAMREWKTLKAENLTVDQDDAFILRLLSFNILAPYLLESYSFLYKGHNQRALSWEFRKPLLIQEIFNAQANVICLQEMQVEHLSEFVTPFKQAGYEYLYKKRTNDKRDGLLFLYRSDQFNLLDYVMVELHQSGIELLNRDNVGIVAKLSLKDSPDTQIVIATTHLLYNPKRNDVRLGQTQLLLAEIERIAFIENTKSQSQYLPIILCGDFNLEPYTGVYRFITEGYIQYHGKARTLETPHSFTFHSLTNSLLPPRLHITDNCQHYNILTKRLRGKGTGKIMLENTELNKKANDTYVSHNANVSEESEIDVDTNNFQTIEITKGHRVNFSSGTLTHPFNMYSVYRHVNEHGKNEVTTFHLRWVTVDYIFYSDMEPVERYSLPSVQDCTCYRIPNGAIGSDHFSIGASFKIQKKKIIKVH